MSKSRTPYKKHKKQIGNLKKRTDIPVAAKQAIHTQKKKSATAEQMLRKIQPSGKREESFFELVYEVARQIPYGRVTSYGAIAACLGTKLSARMVGWAMNGADKVNPTVPAHRVVNRVGLL